jgi:LacI family transcriptional regulator
VDVSAVDIRAVARAAGVSTTTVSHSLNDVGRISPATRERVRRIAAELGYAPNSLARGLRRQRSETIGLLGDEIVTTPFAGRIIAGAQEAAKAHGSLLLIFNTNGEPELEEREAQLLKQRKVDGVLYAAMFHRQVTIPPTLADVPVVLVDAISDDPSISSVVPDEVTGGRDAVILLLSAGHRRIGFLNGEDDIPATHGRLKGFSEALAAAGIQPNATHVLPVPATPEGGYQGGLSLLQSPDRPTGVFCFTDRVAMGCYQAAAEVGLRIPDDLSIVGFDDLQIISEGLRPGLTTIALPHFEMGAWAINRLYAELDARSKGDVLPAEHLVLPGPVVRRSSVAPPPGSSLTGADQITRKAARSAARRPARSRQPK